MLALVEDPPQWGNTALQIDEDLFGRQWVALVWPRLLEQLTEVQRHVLARIAVHTWNHGGSIPFYAPNAHQRAVAFSLGAPELGLVAPLVSLVASTPRLCFRLTRVGDAAARRVFNVLPSAVVERREAVYQRLCALMRNDWEPDEETMIDVAPRRRRPRLQVVR